jgi:hypothetical protein
MNWRPWRREAAAPPGMVPAAALAAQARREAATAPPTADERERELLAERDRLTERFTLMQADLGGVFYEMAIRDHVRMDVLTRKAAELQRVDAALAQVQRALRGDDGPTVGACPACGTPHGAGARFCSGCGQALAPASGAAVVLGETDTAIQSPGAPGDGTAGPGAPGNAASTNGSSGGPA